jgi:monothiol glutaredoxin
MSKNGSLLPLLNTAVPKKDTAANDVLSTNEAIQLVQQGLPDAKVLVESEGCDLSITVISTQFTELTPVKKQQLVLATLKAPLASGKLHAVSVKAYTPGEWQEKTASQSPGLLQIQH